MKILIKTILISIISLSPLIVLAQPTEYVKDNKTRTVVPINPNREKTPPSEPTFTPIVTVPIAPSVPENTVNQPVQESTNTPTTPVATPTIQVSPKTVVEDALAALMQFEKKEVHFGTVKMGEHPSHTFYFKNRGQEPVEIELVSVCDCTDVEYSRTPIAVGSTGFIKATYMSERAPEVVNNKFDKEITIILKNKYPDSGYPMVETLKIQGNVID